MNDEKAIEELERLKRFIEDLRGDIEGVNPGDFCMGLYNWSEDSEEALDFAIDKINKAL